MCKILYSCTFFYMFPQTALEYLCYVRWVSQGSSKCISFIFWIFSYILIGKIQASELTETFPGGFKLVCINPSTKSYNFERAFSRWSFWKMEKWIFYHYFFSQKQLSVATRNHLSLVVSSSFCRRPNSQIIADNDVYITIYFHKALYVFFH